MKIEANITGRTVLSVDGACSGRKAACAAVASRDGEIVAQVSRFVPHAEGYALAAEIAAGDSLGWEQVFLDAMAGARPPWGSRVRGWREVEYRLPLVLDQVLLDGAPVEQALRQAARELDRLLAETER